MACAVPVQTFEDFCFVFIKTHATCFLYYANLVSMQDASYFMEILLAYDEIAEIVERLRKQRQSSTFNTIQHPIFFNNSKERTQHNTNPQTKQSKQTTTQHRTKQIMSNNTKSQTKQTQQQQHTSKNTHKNILIYDL